MTTRDILFILLGMVVYGMFVFIMDRLFLNNKLDLLTEELANEE